MKKPQKIKAAKNPKPKRSAPLKVSAEVEKLWRAAVQAQKSSYSPYSKFPVGAAFSLQTRTGAELVCGANIENASFGATVCAERVALWKAVSERKLKFERLVVVAGHGQRVPPCGQCLQVLIEFCSPEMEVWLGSSEEIFSQHRLGDFLPIRFDASSL